MRMKLFIGAAVSAFLAALTSSASAQAPSSDGTPSESGSSPADPPAAPTSPPAPGDGPASQAPPVDQPPPATAPAAPEQAPPPAMEPQQEPAPTEALVPSQDRMVVFVERSPRDIPPAEPTPIGSKLSPLVLTGSLGYGYAAIKHPELESRSLSGAMLEISAGTELDRRFRLGLAFTSFETKLRRTASGGWEEGDYVTPTAGMRTQDQPIEPADKQMGGAQVQKAFHVHSLGPRLDFLPLGSQGPYVGVTAGLGVITDLSTRVGGNFSARIGGEWRPFHQLGLAIEAGAHGQIYDDSRAAIPYAAARMTLLLEPGALTNAAAWRPSAAPMPFQRNLPPPPPR